MRVVYALVASDVASQGVAPTLALAVAVAGAVTALIAAVFSGLNLYLTGRRETRRWLRESLLDTVVEFLDSSFSQPGREIWEKLSEDAESPHVAALLEQSRSNHFRQNNALTRIRLLAPRELVRSAESLHRADDRILDAVVGVESLPSTSEVVEMRNEQRVARERLITEARKPLGLGPSAPIEQHHRGSLESR